MVRMQKNKGSRAFSLVELSISLAIIGMIVSSALSVALTGDSGSKKHETIAKMEKIEEALAGFLAYNLRLPCPADGTLATTNANFGLEGTRTPAAGGATCTQSNFTSGATRYIEGGVVPVRTLQLPDDFMFDGWGRRIFYAVPSGFTNNQITNTTCDGTTSTACFIDKDGQYSINIKDGSGANLTDQAAYLLLSYGENGHGAYPKNGGATRINGFANTGNPYRTSSPAEMENAEFSNAGAATAFDHEFIDKEFVREDDVTDASREYFDDIARWSKKGKLVNKAGAVKYSSFCRDAKNIVDNPGTNSCTGAVKESECESFATQLFKRCLQ